MSLTQLTATEMAEKLRAGETTAVELVTAHLDVASEAFVHVNREDALAVAADVDAGKYDHPLAGVPVVLSDVIVTTEMPTAAGSAYLDGWVSPYEATVVTRLREAGLPILGKTRVAEFGMGNDSGAHEAVAKHQAPFAVVSDTAGTARHSAAETGVVAVKPTYGAISRYGLVAAVSSMDTITPVARTTADAKALHEILVGADQLDPTSLHHEWDLATDTGVDGVTLGITVTQPDNVSDDAWSAYQHGVRALHDAGITTMEVTLESLDQARQAAHIIGAAEFSANLAKFDGIRFGNRVTPANATVQDVITASRGAGFGYATKRRVMLGTQMLSTGTIESHFRPAQRVRTAIINDHHTAFETVDALAVPATTIQGKEYESATAGVGASLAGLPAASVAGVHICAPPYADELVYRISAVVEQTTAGAAS
ncbi:amidase family protein [Enteractinococcus coprophilus]|uniref:Aspartyl-tRNA(Asn)/glutamyl-tRNA(Gln) amidotransferase subunit A n=1 Tax=Enteractinococcus coprophilus TaxID=1027633 RepID=A0A543AF57_9MICC|nr:amidase family protein [Enteractinococcus coprophilus]TQL71218.1 aspartyl-tRNA(Asn)/glutamyl-tRNA(Gln) amidotransferase subunit A [Enteractinococcus coprophilus]